MLKKLHTISEFENKCFPEVKLDDHEKFKVLWSRLLEIQQTLKHSSLDDYVP